MQLPILPVASGARFTTLDTGGFALTEARYGPGQTLPSHAHQRAVLTFILHGSVRERSGAGVETCQPLGLVSLPAGEPHGESFPGPGTRCLIIEVSHERAEFIGSFSRILDRPSYRHDPPVAGLAMSRTWLPASSCQPPDGVIHPLAAGSWPLAATFRP